MCIFIYKFLALKKNRVKGLQGFILYSTICEGGVVLPGWSYRMKHVVFYRGPSEINGLPVIGVLTKDTRNIKTGNMVQTWYLPDHKCKVSDSRKIQDRSESICGTCIHQGRFDADGDRQKASVTCYVNDLGINAVYNSTVDLPVSGFDEVRDAVILWGKSIRLGAFGDPVAVPFKAHEPIWEALDHAGLGSVGYTHQWREGRFKIWHKWLMASVESYDDIPEDPKWRYFRAANCEPRKGEIMCPNTAQTEKGYDNPVQCEQCLLCDPSKGAKNIFNPLHGPAFRNK